MATLRLEKELARDLADTEAPCHALLDAAPISAVIENRTVKTKDYTAVKELVLKDMDGKFWRQEYEVGLSVYVDDRAPFEDYGKEVPFVEVKAVPVVAYNYEPV